MSLFSTILSFSFILNALTAIASPLPALESRAYGVDQSTYSELERYAKYSSATYQWICPRPLGNKVVSKVYAAFSSLVMDLLLTAELFNSLISRVRRDSWSEMTLARSLSLHSEALGISKM